MKFAVLAPIAALAVCLHPLAWAQPGEPIAQPGTQPANPPVVIRGIEYQKLATREATEARMMSLLLPTKAEFGEWHVLLPFEFKQQGDLKLVLEPEKELERMTAGGPGPDLAKTYPGKDGRQAKWIKVGRITDRVFDMGEGNDPAAISAWMVGYMHSTIQASEDTTLDITAGADDGLKLWVNGKPVIDADLMRGLNPEDHRVRLDLKKGVNHVFAKVSQGQGAYQFQLNYRPKLDELTEQMLAYHLEMDFPSTPEAEYYPSFSVALPDDVVLEVGGLDVLPDGRPIVSTRRGDIYIVDGAYDEPAFKGRFTRFATGLHEPLGLSVRRETEGGKGVTAVYAVQRGELTRMVDTTGDFVADVYQTFADGWGVSGNYHEFAFGPKFDREGHAWVTLNVGFCGALGKSVVPWRGWALRISPTGSIEAICGGLRSPNGIGFWTDGQAFYLDNQGDYVGTNRLQPLIKGGFAGHPSGLRWDERHQPGQPAPAVTPAAVWFPYRKMGQSAADFLLYDPASGHGKAGAFGPFEGQAFVGDQTLCLVMRVSLEKVDGVYQGACYPFRRNLQCGVNRLAWGADGSMFVGQTDRGWGSIGRKRYGLERIRYAGQTPFELREMRAASDGFVLEFTRDVPDSALDPAAYVMSSYTYEYHQTYGSDEMQTKPVAIQRVNRVNPRTVRLITEPLRSGGMGFVHELEMPGVRDGAGAGLLHPVAYYTLQRVPKATN